MEKNYSFEMLEGKIPSSIYALLMSDNPMSLPDCSEEDWDKAHEYLCPDVPTGWQVVKVQGFTSKEKACVENCRVVKSAYGLNIKFNMRRRTPVFIPCSSDSSFVAGRYCSINNLKILTLRREGSPDIYRVTNIDQQVKVVNYPDIPNEEYELRNTAWNKVAPIMRAQLKRQGKKIDVFRYLKLY